MIDGINTGQNQPMQGIREGGCVIKDKGAVSPDILKGLQEDYGTKDPIANLSTHEGIETLRGYYIKGYDLPIPEPSKMLGPKWKENRPRQGNYTPVASFSLGGPPKQSKQIITFNPQTKKIDLFSIDERTMGYEVLIMNANGEVKREM